MTDPYTILVLNGASSSEKAPNYISVVQRINDIYHVVAEEKTTLKGGPERFPIYFQEFIKQGRVKPQQIDLIAVIVGPGSFTGLRASIAFALGIQVGLGGSAIGLRRGEVLFPFLEKTYPTEKIWHVTQARRGRVFIENNQDGQVIAYNEVDLLVPAGDLVLTGEAAEQVIPYALSDMTNIQVASIFEPNAEQVAKIADIYQQQKKNTNILAPLYVDPPEAKLPQKGLRKPPQS